MKRFISSALAASMILGSATFPSLASQFSDVNGHWGENAIERWLSYGIVEGDEHGNFNPDAVTSRAQMAQFLANLLNLKAKADISGYADVNVNAWYADALSKCVAAGILKGTDEGLSPDAEVTREQAFVMFARAVGIDEQNSMNTEYPDSASVSDWAEGYINALINEGYVSGTGDGTIAPLATINRASIMQLFDNTITHYANVPGTVLDVNESGLALVVADGVTVKGDVDTLVVTSKNVNLDGAKITNLEIVAADSSVSLSGGATVENANIAQAADGASLKVDKSSTVNSLVSDGENVTVSGEGTVKDAVVSGNNTAIDTTGTNLKVEEGVTGTTNNGSSVSGGTTVETKPSTPSTGGGNDSGGSTPSAPTEEEVEADIKDIVNKADEYEYSDNYVYSGVYTVTEDGDTLTINSVYDAVALMTNPDVLTHDLARFLGALHRTDDGATVKSIVYNGNTYTWDTEGTLLGSNWKNGDTTLVSAIVADVLAGNNYGITLKGNSSAEVAVAFNSELTASNEAGLTAALATGLDVTVNGTIGSESEYGTYTVARPVTIKGENGSKVYGSFIVKADGVVFDGVTIHNKGGSDEHKNAINAYTKKITIKDCTFESGSAFANGVVIFPSAADVNFNITGNTFNGYDNGTSDWATTGLMITGGYTMSSKPFFGVTENAFDAAGIDDEAIITGNTFANCSVDYTRDNWSENNTKNKVFVRAISAGENFYFEGAADTANYYVNGDVTISESKTVKAGTTLKVMEGKSLTIGNGATLTVNGTVSGKIIVAEGGDVKIDAHASKLPVSTEIKVNAGGVLSADSTADGTPIEIIGNDSTSRIELTDGNAVFTFGAHGTKPTLAINGTANVPTDVTAYNHFGSEGDIIGIEMTVKGSFAVDGTFKVTSANGTVSGSAMTIAKGSTLTVNGTLSVASKGTVTNNGTLSVAAKGAVTNNGTLSVASKGAVTNNGTLENNGTISNSGIVTNNGTMTGSGTVTGNDVVDNNAPVQEEEEETSESVVTE